MSKHELAALERAIEALSKAGPKMPAGEADSDELEAHLEELARTSNTGDTGTRSSQI